MGDLGELAGSLRHGASVSRYGAAGCRILGTGSYLPGDPVSNETVVSALGTGETTAEWIESHTGIRVRHWADPSLATSDLAACAGREALDRAKISAESLGHILLCSTTADWVSPAAAGRVQRLLGATCPAEDKQVACASWLFGLDHGARLCATGSGPVLVVGADVKSRFVGRKDHRLRPVFADGAAAVVLGAGLDDGYGLRTIQLFSDGSHALNLYTPAGGSRVPASQETVDDDLHTVHMAVPGSVIKADAISIMAGSVRNVLHATGWSLDDVDHFVGHQANLAILRGLADELGVSLDRWPITIDRTGNIVSATLPFTLDDLLRSGRVSAGDRIVLTTAGAGYAGGAATYVVPPT
jgi:3-oxoacyl-[acyl-carrier-protein] synthase-3